MRVIYSDQKQILETFLHFSQALWTSKTLGFFWILCCRQSWYWFHVEVASISYDKWCAARQIGCPDIDSWVHELIRVIECWVPTMSGLGSLPAFQYLRCSQYWIQPVDQSSHKQVFKWWQWLSCRPMIQSSRCYACLKPITPYLFCCTSISMLMLALLSRLKVKQPTIN
jgi:hypothetical protein